MQWFFGYVGIFIFDPARRFLRLHNIYLETISSKVIIELQTLIRQQFLFLHVVQDVPRTEISGTAGTGKTVLAMKEARCCVGSGVAHCSSVTFMSRFRKLRTTSSCAQLCEAWRHILAG